MEKPIKIIEISRVGDGSVVGTMINELNMQTNYEDYFWVICVPEESISRTVADCKDLKIGYLVCDRKSMVVSGNE